ncbi:hypothetical protein B7494_g8516 [Chlorociboria aeruginascens]|nr:hypothetical protein B7494_g8516 [Chlorociboria aeruginascens]
MASSAHTAPTGSEFGVSPPPPPSPTLTPAGPSQPVLAAPAMTPLPPLPQKTTNLMNILYEEPILREAICRPNRIIKLNRSSNYEAVIAQRIGQINLVQCRHCQQGSGPFVERCSFRRTPSAANIAAAIDALIAADSFVSGSGLASAGSSSTPIAGPSFASAARSSALYDARCIRPMHLGPIAADSFVSGSGLASAGSSSTPIAGPSFASAAASSVNNRIRTPKQPESVIEVPVILISSSSSGTENSEEPEKELQSEEEWEPEWSPRRPPNPRLQTSPNPRLVSAENFEEPEKELRWEEEWEPEWSPAPASPRRPPNPQSFCEASITSLSTDKKKPSLQVQRIIQFLDCYYTKHTALPHPIDQKLFHLSSVDDLFSTLQLNSSLWAYFQDKIRYDYFPRIERFVLRMPSHLHELCVTSLVNKISSQLNQYQASSNIESQAFAKEILCTGSPDLKFPPDDDGHASTHCPDGSFRHQDAKWPGVIIEIAFSQTTKNLDHLAWEYIGDSDGAVLAVVGLNLDYYNKKANLSVWRPSITVGINGIDVFTCVRTVNQDFMDSDGNVRADEEQGLCLQLRDFGAIESVLSNPDAFLEPVFISYRALGEMMLHARQVIVKQANAPGRVLKAGTIKLQRAPSPGTEITSDDEVNWEARENWDDEKSEEKDPDYTD